MKYIFYYSNSLFPYSGIVAAAHLGALKGEPPYIRDFVEKFFYRNEDSERTGRPYYAGTDLYNNHVYAVWNSGRSGMVYKLMLSFLEMYEIKKKNIFLVDTKLKDSILSILACKAYAKGFDRGGKLLAERVIQNNFSIISEVAGKSFNENLTKDVAYQIMLP